MARIRTIKPEFFRHEALYEAERETGLPLRIAFAGLWTAADRDGRFRWAPRQLKLDCLPYDDVDFSRVLDALTTRGFIVRYTSDGKDCGHIPSWNVHQVINNREKPSELPAPNENNTLTREARVPDATPTPLVQVQGEGKGREGEREISGGVEAREPQRGKSLISEEAFEITSDLLKAMGLASDDPVSVGAPMQIQSWINGGWARDVIVTGVQRGMKSRRGDPPSTFRYFENAIARAHAEFTRDLPKVEFKPAETITVTHGTAQNKSASAYAKRLAEQFESQSSDSIAGNPDAFLRLSQG